MESGHLPTRNSVVQEPGFLDAFDQKFPGEGLFAQNLTNVTKARPVSRVRQIAEALGEAIVKVMLGKATRRPRWTTPRTRWTRCWRAADDGGRREAADGRAGLRPARPDVGPLTGWLFVLPAVFLIALFGIFPIIWWVHPVVAEGDLISPTRRWSASTTTRTSRATRCRGRRSSNAWSTPPVRADVDHRRVVPRDRVEPADPVDPLLPARGVHPGCGLDDRDRR